MTAPVIITVAITGALPRKKDNPAVPVTPAESLTSRCCTTRRTSGCGRLGDASVMREWRGGSARERSRAARTRRAWAPDHERSRSARQSG